MKTEKSMFNKPDLTPKSKSKTVGMILALVVILLILKVSRSDAQSLSTGLFTEKTVMGMQIGASLGINTERGLYVGGFFQRNTNSHSEISRYGYELAGIEVSQYLLGNHQVALAPVIRLGISDRQQVVLVPGFKASARIKDRLVLHLGSSIRASEATMVIGLSLDLPTRIKHHRPKYL